MAPSLPPMTMVGSIPPWLSTWATMLVVVVLPWEPAMAMPYFMRISSASISPRGITGTLAARAATTSGLLPFTALEITTTWAFSMHFASWPMVTCTPRLARRWVIGLVLQVGPAHLVAEVHQHLGDAGHADAADADEVDVAESFQTP